MDEIIHFVVYSVNLLGFFALNYKQTRWVLGKFRKVIRRFSSREVTKIAFDMFYDEEEQDNKAFNGYYELNGELTRTDSKREHIKLQHIFSHDRAFDIFMNYLYKQHCAEVLLSLVTMTQFQQLIYDDLWTTLAINELNGQSNNNDSKFNLFNNNNRKSVAMTPSPMFGPTNKSGNYHKKSSSISISLKSLGPFNNHNRNGNYKPFEIQVPSISSGAAPNASNSNQHSVVPPSNTNSSKVSLELVNWNGIFDGNMSNNLSAKYGNSSGVSNSSQNRRYHEPLTEEDEETKTRSSLDMIDKQISKMGEALVSLPATIPRSSIVYCRFETEDRKTQENIENAKINMVGKLKKYRYIAYDIYEKYIRIGAEYEINIDFTNRKRYNKLLGNKSKWIHKSMEYQNDDNILYNAQYLQEAMILFSLYQPAIDQMYRFCSSCFATFKNTTEFNHLTDLFKIKNVETENF